MERISFYKTIKKVRWSIGDMDDRRVKDSFVYDIYILPMLRFVNQGPYEHLIQFKWIIWGINIKLK